MLTARVAPPLPDGELPQQVNLGAPSGQQVIELVSPPGALLVRRLAADLISLGYEVAWIRPMPFESDTGSLAPLLVTALSGARPPFPGQNEPVVVVESPTAAQAEALLDQLLVPGMPPPCGPSVVLVVDGDQTRRRRHIEMTRIHVGTPARDGDGGWNPASGRRGKVPIRQLSVAAGGRSGLIDGTLRSISKIGMAELGRIAAKAREPGALIQAVAQRVLDDAPAAQLAALGMASHLGYAHERLGSLVPAMAGSDHHPWWVPLAAGWWQVDPAWRRCLVACAAGATGVSRSACLSRLVGELAEAGAVAEAIELCISAGWSGLAADLVTEEAEALLSSGRHLALARWLERLPAGEVRSRPALADVAAELIPAEPAGAGAVRAHAQPGFPAAVASGGESPAPVPSAQRRMGRLFRRPGRRPPGFAAGPDRAVRAILGESGRVKGSGTPAAGTSAPAGHESWPEPVNGAGSGTRAGEHADEDAAVRVEARLLGSFELLVQGRPVDHWRGNRGRMLLAFLLLHRTRPLARDELGAAFWPDGAPDIVRNRLHVALYGLRRDLRRLCNHPIVVHGQRGFSLHPGVDLWLDTEVFDKALQEARREHAHGAESALTWYESALRLYRGDLLEDAPLEEWVLLRREQLRLQHLDALDQVARLRFAAGRYTDCIEICQRLIPGDLCREDMHRLVMRCYARLNQPHLAVRQYHQCERQLRDELGIQPAESTRQLYERIRRREFV